MAKITIEELFYGDKYGVTGEVVKQVFARQDEFIAAPHTFRELEIVRQTLIAVVLVNLKITKSKTFATLYSVLFFSTYLNDFLSITYSKIQPLNPRWTKSIICSDKFRYWHESLIH